MKLKPEALAAHLQRGTAPVYMVSGDEPLQVLEATDAIRQQARDQGFSDRKVFEVGRGFDWNSLLAEGNAMSLFAERRVIELRIPGGKPGRDGGAALVEWLAQPPQDTLLLITMPKLEGSQRNTKWYKSIDQAGVVIQVWPITGNMLASWMRGRAQQQGLHLEDAALQLLIQHTEGNLLAASQEIEKLRLTHDDGKVTLEQVASSVSGNSHYTPFEMVDAALAGQGGHALHMLAVLRAEGVAVPVLLWALARDLRLLVELASAEQRRQSVNGVFDRHRVWESRRGLLHKALTHQSLQGWAALLDLAARIDDAVKGGGDDPWLLIESLLAGVSGHSLKAVC